MKELLISYSTKHLLPRKQVQIVRELYGYTDVSKHGKYRYERSGILTGIFHKRIRHGCFQIHQKHLSMLKSFFKKWNVKIEVY
ncbi:hypothetical protein J4410_04415 [Candidatus Woesearchaeota archaeon]|nr:hypothetical protein [Candidatus Woesearchaeota archaeon]